MKKFMQFSVSLTLVTVGLVTVGCVDVGDKTKELSQVPAKNYDDPKFAAEAGLSANVDQSPSMAAAALAKTKPFGWRADAFALLPSEKAFDRQQSTLRLVGEGGGFVTMFTTPEDVEEVPVALEPLPNWRLAGVVIGDGVAALLDMGGRVIDIRPGMKIPDTDWTVVSIDSERATLKRNNGKLPKVFIVPLQGAQEFGGGSPNGGNNNGGGEQGNRGGSGGGSAAAAK